LLSIFFAGIILVSSLEKDLVLNKVVAPNASKGGAPKKKYSNSLGLKVEKKMIVESFPFKVERCDQMVHFKAKYIHDMGDYRFRKDGFFTITAYYVNQFKDKDAKKLDESILLTESKFIARHLKGARGCIYIDGGNFRNDIAICLDTKAKAKNILNVINDFARCRMGDNLKPIPLATIKKLIRDCGKNGKPGKKGKKGKNGKAKNNKKSDKKKKNKKGKKVKKVNDAWTANRAKFFHPLKLQVPGTR